LPLLRPLIPAKNSIKTASAPWSANLELSDTFGGQFLGSKRTVGKARRAIEHPVLKRGKFMQVFLI
jgi:hypothetical protein